MAPGGDSRKFTTPGIVKDVIEQHADDAAFLWRLRDAATDQPHYALSHLADLEERVDANIDGLRVAQEAGLGIAWAQLEQSGGPGELFVVAMLSLGSRDPSKIERVLQFAETVPQSRRGLFGAVGWVARDVLRGQVMAWLDAASSFRRLVGTIACSLHRADVGTRMERLLADEPPVRARTLRLVGELGRLDLREHLGRSRDDADEACRAWATWSAGLLGDRANTIPVLQEYAVAGKGVFKWQALDLAVRLMDRENAISWLKTLGRDPRHARLLVVAVGSLGDAAAVPWLIQKMSVPALARVAGESFSMITGVDFSKSDLDGKVPEGFAAGPNDDPGDENVEMDEDENLSWPHQAKVQAWWQKEQARFTQSVRYVRGLP
ncbi:MAG: hypothetical protein DMD87_28420, partial [Candidatus Rokuibacteriota bacterium]